MRLRSCLVEATLADVPNPFDRLGIGVVQFVLEHFQIANFEAGGRERHFEIHRDRRTVPFLLVVGQQFDLGAQLRLLHAAHALHLPDDGVVRRFMPCLALHAQQLHVAGIRRRRYAYFDLLADERRLEVRLDHDFHFHLRSADLSDERNDAKGQIDVLGRSVAHQLEFPIGRNERNRVFGFELGQLHALMKLTVVDGNGRLGCRRRWRVRRPVGGRRRRRGVRLRFRSVLHGDLVVDAELALRHAGEIALHHDAAGHVRTENLALLRHE